MTEDPIKDGLNWYAYCGGNPVNAWDPSGMDDIVVTDENDQVQDVRYDIDRLVRLFGGVWKVENDTVKIKVLGKKVSVNLSALKNAEENLPEKD